MLLNCVVGEDSRVPWTARRSVLNVRWKDWCWSWNANTLAIWCEELTHWKRPWYWERLRAGGEGDNRGWDGWMASSTQWTWVWVNSGSWWWTGRPGMLQFLGSQCQTRLSNWTELNYIPMNKQVANQRKETKTERHQAPHSQHASWYHTDEGWFIPRP